MGSISDKTHDISVIVTGGLSGIGLAIVKQVATLWPDIRTHISIFDLNELQGMKVVKSLENDTTSGTNHASFSFHHCNVASWDSLAEAFADVVTQRSKIDIVFANAGVAEKGAFLQLSASKEPKKPNMLSCDINFYGVLYTVNLAIHYMRMNQISPLNSLRGRIICTASNSGLYPFALEPMYAAAKHGVVGLVRSLGPQLAQARIQINGLAPCIVETNIAPGVGKLPGIVLTPLKTITHAVTILLEDSNTSGQIAEISEDRVTFAQPQIFVDKSTADNYAILDAIAVGGPP